MAAVPAGNRNALAWAALAFAAATGCAVLILDWHLGYPLAAFRFEYAGGGSCKLRGNDGFAGFLLFALLGFPAAVLAAILFASSLRRQVLAGAMGLIASVAAAVVLARLDYVGPALGICPLPAIERGAPSRFQLTCSGVRRGASLKALTNRMAKLGAKREFIGEADFFFREHWLSPTEVCEVSSDGSGRVTSAYYSTR